MSEFVYKEEYRWLTNACLNLTDACNCQCRYCFVEQHPHYMTLETAHAAVNYLLENLDKKRQHTGNQQLRASITYFGGEPTLLWDEIIVPLTSWIREENLPIDLSMTTNGTLLNEERIKFLYDNNVPILLSIDGDKETQDYNRPCGGKSSFDAVAANIPTILKYFPNTTFRATIWPETAHLTANNYLFAIQQGFKNVFFMPDARHPWSKEQKEALHDEVHKIFALNSWFFANNLFPVGFSTIEDNFEKIVKLVINNNSPYPEELEIQRNCNRCGLGTSMGAIGFDGSIYGCQEQPSKNNNIFYIGNIFNDGIDIEKHLQLLNIYNKKEQAYCVNRDLCNNCLLRQICFSPTCPSSSWDLFQGMNIAAEIDCLWRKWIFEDCCTFNEHFVKHNNQTYKKYLEQKCNFKKYTEEVE